MKITARFESRCTKCHNVVLVGSPVEWNRNVKGVEHLPGTCPAPAPIVVNLNAVRTPTPVIDQSLIVAFLTAAKAHIKNPKVRFLAPDGASELRLSLAGSTSKYQGAIQVKVGFEWMGRINVDGTVIGRGIDAALLTTLTTIAVNPAAAAKAYGALMGRCSFCNLQLTDAGSVEVGYGPICASHYGLPHHPKGTKAVLTVGMVPVAAIEVSL